MNKNYEGIGWVSDSGHSWLKVNFVDYPSALEFTTGFGFIDQARGFVYLEEDCEAVGFLKASNSGAIDWEAVAEFPEESFDDVAPCRSLPRSAAVFDVSKLYEVAE